MLIGGRAFNVRKKGQRGGEKNGIAGRQVTGKKLRFSGLKHKEVRSDGDGIPNLREDGKIHIYEAKKRPQRGERQNRQKVFGPTGRGRLSTKKKKGHVSMVFRWVSQKSEGMQGATGRKCTGSKSWQKRRGQGRQREKKKTIWRPQPKRSKKACRFRGVTSNVKDIPEPTVKRN